MTKEIFKCKYEFQNEEKFNGEPYCTLFNELCEDLSFICGNNCQVYEDYKQLKCKEQECEKYKACLDYIKDNGGGNDSFIL